ncbi:MAG: alanine--tRNA ligase [Eubacteriales bacterium]|nr:alanine--tRNA ligase [Eubacteriales bacterium]
MQPYSLNVIREKFLAFFESKAHLRLPSFPLVPRNDPSILLINAGMTPLKPYFTGAETPPAPRVTTCQKCIRTPDIERVGKTSRHGTYFEMLGNFSFGDYFKKDIIPWAWEFCTKVMEIPEEKLFVTVYLDDDEAYDIWHKDVGLAESKIFRLGKADNFWEHGTGPCGPCSEIYFDRGEEHGCDSPTCQVGCDCDRYVEFWNLVFTQFNKEEDGSYTPLAKKNIDTGAGLERFAVIMQGVENLFEVDTVRAILDYVCVQAKVTYGADEKTDVAIRVITDHIRSTTMMISDGIIPSNEGRGYVLRRLLRRAARFGRMLGIENAFLFDVAAIVIRESKTAYPELEKRQDYIIKVIRTEEERFAETIAQGTAIVEQMITTAKKNNRINLSGEDIFKLHDTFGFPLDLTREIAAEQGLDIDEEGFRAEMNRQKTMARKAMKDRGGSAWGQGALPEGIDRDLATLFTGYDSLTEQSTVRAILVADEATEALALTDLAVQNQIVTVLTERTPFYGASGGQVGDVGTIEGQNGVLRVTDTTKTPEGLYLHVALVEQGSLALGDAVTLTVDRTVRLSTARNHTTTHILHKALREVLGEHVAQAGSAVSPDRLRFDFTHFEPMTIAEKATVEAKVNAIILDNQAVQTNVMTLDEARHSGAMALFDEKYGDRVRVVSVGNYSQELCGGTHLKNSSEAGLFRLVSESGVAAGVRRIEAITGQAALAWVNEKEDLLEKAGQLIKAPAHELPIRLEALLHRTRELEKQIEAEQARKTAGAADELASQAFKIGPFNVLAARLDAPDADQLRLAGDRLRDKLTPAILILAAAQADKVALVAMASPEAVKAGANSGNLIREAAKICGGGGGGRPDMAQAGGKDISKIDAALAAAIDLVKLQVG